MHHRSRIYILANALPLLSLFSLAGGAGQTGENISRASVVGAQPLRLFIYSLDSQLHNTLGPSRSVLDCCPLSSPPTCILTAAAAMASVAGQKRRKNKKTDKNGFLLYFACSFGKPPPCLPSQPKSPGMLCPCGTEVDEREKKNTKGKTNRATTLNLLQSNRNRKKEAARFARRPLSTPPSTTTAATIASEKATRDSKYVGRQSRASFSRKITPQVGFLDLKASLDLSLTY